MKNPVQRFWENRKLAVSPEAEGGVQVVTRGGRLELRLGSTVIQSALMPTGEDLPLAYTKAMMGVLMFSPAPTRVLHLGLGGGTMARFLHHRFPWVHQTALEPNPEVVTAARRYFSIPDSPRLQIIPARGEDFLEGTKELYDVILLDAYSGQGPVEALHTLRAYQQLAERLTPNGWLADNLWGEDTPRLKRHLGAMANSFRHQRAIVVGTGANLIVFASNTPDMPGPTRLAREGHRLSEWTGLDMMNLFRRIRPLEGINLEDL
ncbi:MAG: hypothetical protein OEV94_06630 [Deltaproteobacteria bacterium]|nr:hypothetical protein [Deltaproteobacteria bacterium]